MSELVIWEEGRKCPKCGQTTWHTGEYPCEVCGRPLTWDDPEEPTQSSNQKGENMKLSRIKRLTWEFEAESFDESHALMKALKDLINDDLSDMVEEKLNEKLKELGFQSSEQKVNEE